MKVPMDGVMELMNIGFVHAASTNDIWELIISADESGLVKKDIVNKLSIISKKYFKNLNPIVQIRDREDGSVVKFIFTLGERKTEDDDKVEGRFYVKISKTTIYTGYVDLSITDPESDLQDMMSEGDFYDELEEEDFNDKILILQRDNN